LVVETVALELDHPGLVFEGEHCGEGVVGAGEIDVAVE
jgi:hypothetical protein